tara:strand:+ start:338 stop:607 length:270 start_codon:yes stop_codon:yes gene_type:complete
MNALIKGGLVFKRLRRYSLFGKKKKNPFNVIWYAIRNNRDLQMKQNSEVLLSMDDICREMRNQALRITSLEALLKNAPKKRGRPRKQTK